MSQLDIKIGPKIKAFRRQLGLQANKLSEDLGISPSYLNLIESGKRKIDGDLLLKVCEKLNIQLSDLTSKSDINLENTISEILDDKLFEDLDILGPEVKDLVGTNPKIGRALVRLGDILKKKDHELINKIEKQKNPSYKPNWNNSSQQEIINQINIDIVNGFGSKTTSTTTINRYFNSILTGSTYSLLSFNATTSSAVPIPVNGFLEIGLDANQSLDPAGTVGAIVYINSGSSPYQTVFAEVTRSGSASMAIAFTGSIANDAYQVLLSHI